MPKAQWLARMVAGGLALAIASAGAGHVSAAPAGDAAERVARAAAAQVGVTRLYDPSYVKLSYPRGDVATDRGICADVVVRAYRAVGLDLPAAVHADMSAHFAAYPRLWGLRAPDSSIDHRRVANLMTYFQRQGEALPLNAPTAAWRPADVVAWRLPGGRLHVGVISDQRGTNGEPLVVHNIGQGAQLEDVLFAWTVVGHYRPLS